MCWCNVLCLVSGKQQQCTSWTNRTTVLVRQCNLPNSCSVTVCEDIDFSRGVWRQKIFRLRGWEDTGWQAGGRRTVGNCIFPSLHYSVIRLALGRISQKPPPRTTTTGDIYYHIDCCWRTHLQLHSSCGTIAFLSIECIAEKRTSSEWRKILFPGVGSSWREKGFWCEDFRIQFQNATPKTDFTSDETESGKYSLWLRIVLLFLVLIRIRVTK